MLNLTPTDVYGILRGNNVSDDEACRIIEEMIRQSHYHDLSTLIRDMSDRSIEMREYEINRFRKWHNRAITPEDVIDVIKGRPVDDNGHPNHHLDQYV